MVDVARLEKHESVLIRAGAGGLVQAAVQVAKICRAKVYVVVEAEEEKERISKALGFPESQVFHIQNPSLVERIKRGTFGTGVNVILDGLPDSSNAIETEWHHTLAPFGRLAELGGRDDQAMHRPQGASKSGWQVDGEGRGTGTGGRLWAGRVHRVGIGVQRPRGFQKATVWAYSGQHGCARVS